MTGRGAYADRLRRVVDFVATHLHEALTLDALADVASSSPYHFPANRLIPSRSAIGGSAVASPDARPARRRIGLPLHLRGT